MNYKNRSKYIFIFLFFLLYLHCWNKQDNEITRPNIPNYTLSGYTVRYNSVETILPNTQIRIQAVELLYETDFPTKTIESDSTGKFSFSGMVPGSYLFSVKSNNVWLQNEHISMEHTDRTMDIRVPNTIPGVIHPNSIVSSGTSKENQKRHKIINSDKPGFYVSNNNSMFPSKKYDIDKTTILGQYFCKTTLQNNTVYYYNEYKSSTNLDNIYQITADTDYIYALKVPDSLLVFDKWQYNLIKTIKLEFILKDITFDVISKTLLACTDSVLYEIITDPLTLTEIVQLPVESISSLTCNKGIFYVYDKSVDLVHQLHPNMTIENTYAIVHKLDNYHITDVYDINFDSFDNLWITK